jgi:hypothetical protein
VTWWCPEEAIVYHLGGKVAFYNSKPYIEGFSLVKYTIGRCSCSNDGVMATLYSGLWQLAMHSRG